MLDVIIKVQFLSEDGIFETLGFTYKDDPQSIEYKLRTLVEENLVSPMRKVSVGVKALQRVKALLCVRVLWVKVMV